jgi:hypothetical protein
MTHAACRHTPYPTAPIAYFGWNQLEATQEVERGGSKSKTRESQARASKALATQDKGLSDSLCSKVRIRVCATEASQASCHILLIYQSTLQDPSISICYLFL